MQPDWGRLERVIVGLVALVVVVSLAGGGGFYSFVHWEEVRDARRRVAVSRDEVAAYLNQSLGESARIVATLGGDTRPQRALLSGAPAAIDDANHVLDLCGANELTEVCYLIDREGKVVASSNRFAPESFVGESYAFRPYFAGAIAGQPTVYPALGVTSNRRGIYFSHPVTGPAARDPLGVVVVKSGAEHLEHSFSASPSAMVVMDADGMVLLSNRPGWRLRPLWEVTTEQQRTWSESRQFGSGPWAPIGSRRRGGAAISVAGAEYELSAVALPAFPGWRLAVLLDRAALTRDAWRNTLVPGLLILVLCLTLCGVGWLFVRWGRQEVRRRALVEESRERLIAELRESLDQVKRLEGLLPICSRCKKIRDEHGRWEPLESYLHEHSEARFTHGICSECAAVLFPGVRTGDPAGST